MNIRTEQHDSKGKTTSTERNWTGSPGRQALTAVFIAVLFSVSSAGVKAGDRKQSSVPEGSRVVMTGVVIADQPATATVVDPSGAALVGVVVDVNGEKVVSDEMGRIPIIAAAGVSTVAASLYGLADSPVSEARVLPPVSPDSVQAPRVDQTPSNPAPGSQTTIRAAGFDGRSEGNTVQLGEASLDVLASSPAELIVVLPQDMPLGAQELTVNTQNGISEPVEVDVTRIWFESADTNLRPGQQGQGHLRISCQEPRSVQVSNLSEVITLSGGETQTVLTSGGTDNGAPIHYTANHVGTFQIRAEIVDSYAEGSDVSDHDYTQFLEGELPIPVLFGPGPLATGPSNPREWLAKKATDCAAASSITENSQNRKDLKAEAKLDQSVADNDKNWDKDGQPHSKRKLKDFLNAEIRRLKKIRRKEGDGGADDQIEDAIKSAYEAGKAAGLKLD